METPKHVPIIDTLEALNALMTSLLKERGIVGHWTAFGTINEGKMLPGMESSSGMLLTEDGRVFTWWLDWDEQKTAPDGTKGWYTLGENFKDPSTGESHPLFHEVKPGTESYPKPDDSSFLAAKKKLGLV